MPEMEQDEAQRRFGAARVARLATVTPEGRPQLVPIVFARHDDVVVTAIDHKPKRSQRLGRLRNIAAHPAVSLLVDVYDEDWDRLWWVRADGDARTLQPDAPNAPDAPTPQEYAAAIELLRQKYPQYRKEPPEGPVIAVRVQRWTGWRAVQEDDTAW